MGFLGLASDLPATWPRVIEKKSKAATAVQPLGIGQIALGVFLGNLALVILAGLFYAAWKN